MESLVFVKVINAGLTVHQNLMAFCYLPDLTSETLRNYFEVPLDLLDLTFFHVYLLLALGYK